MGVGANTPGYPLAWLFGAYGIASVQAVADVLTLIPAIPLILSMLKKIREAEAQTLSRPETAEG